MSRIPSRNETGFPLAPVGSSDASVVTGPLPGMMVINTGDPLEVLPAEAREKVADLHRRRADVTTLYRSVFEDEQMLRAEIFKHEVRIAELMEPRGQGGFGLDDSAPQVVAEQKRLAQKRSDLARLLTLKEARSSDGRRLGELLRSIEQAIAGRPAGTVGKMVEIDPPSFKGDLIDAIAGKQRRGRELRADLARIRCAPHPSAARKAAMVEQVAGWVEQGRPDAAASIEHGAPITWPLANCRFDVHNAGPGAIAFGQLVDVVAFMAWWDRQGMIERLSAELDAVADDDAALSDEERREQEAQTLADLLAVEREECRLVEIAQMQGLPADFRADADPRAILQIEWGPAPEPREDAGEAGIVRHIGQ
ncbi:hypothetical protein [Bradyrhizobium liaoningense]